ncbi:MAG: sigma-70 family RNA polymerase sigma factor [Deltaproteobacteria bacterium]|nr:sigma-70 family RNA polymerase sigma factor [Deltaproteobacteria bacterium]
MSSPDSDAPAPDQTPAGLVAHFVRHASARVVARLARRFGVGALADVEDAVQDALVVALTSWSLQGLPADPAGWLYRVAYNAQLDRLRRRAVAARLAPEATDAAPATTGPEPDGARLPGEVADDQLRMLFVCCDPQLPAESQLVLALKVLCGFGTAEIALRLFTTEANVYKRLARARDALRARAVELDTPLDLAARLPSVQMVLYLLFNEGYGAARRDALVRRDLCDEALRLAYLLLAHPPCDHPTTRALVALFHLHAARLATRVDAAGDLLLLADQDRSRWDRDHIARGLRWLAASADGDVLSRFHAEAAIAAEHALAPTFAATRWREIADLYQLLDRCAPSPLNALNRAVAIAEVDGAAAGLAALEGVRLPPGMAGYYLWDAVVGDLLVRADRPAQARPYLARAAAAAPTDAERALLARRLARCDAVLEARPQES